MGYLNAAENKIYFISDNGEKVLLLDLLDFLSNRSNVPLHFIGDNKSYEIIPDIITNLISEYNEVKGGNGDPTDSSMMLLVAIMIIKRFMYKSKKSNILEIGCTDGTLSYLIGLLMKYFEKINLHCVSDVISSYSQSDWLNKIMKLDNADNISITYANYDNINLKDSFYDITIINSNDYFEDPENLIRNCIDLTKKGGMLLCIGKHQPLLCSTFQAIIDDCDTYEFNVDNIIFTKLLDDRDKIEGLSISNKNKLEEIKASFIGLESKVNKIECLDIDNLDNIISIVSELQKQVLEVYDSMDNIDIKFELSELKEVLINYRVAKSTREKDFNIYLDICREKYYNVKMI